MKHVFDYIGCSSCIHIKFNNYQSSLSFKMRLNEAPELMEFYTNGLINEPHYCTIALHTVGIRLDKRITKNQLHTVFETLARLCLFCTEIAWISVLLRGQSRHISYMDLLDPTVLESFEL